MATQDKQHLLWSPSAGHILALVFSEAFLDLVWKVRQDVDIHGMTHLGLDSQGPQAHPRLRGRWESFLPDQILARAAKCIHSL